jgi:hypothetical protein
MRTRLLLPAGLIAAAITLLAASNMTTLTIEVKSLNDHPVERASVIVKFVKGRAKLKLGKKILTTWETRTNQEGVAKIPPVPQGTIRVQVIARVPDLGQVFDVDDEGNHRDQVNPPQAQYSSHQ